jgi:hypothetical protein
VRLNPRLAAAALLLPLGIRRREIEALFALTAEAFGRPPPPRRAHRADGRDAGRLPRAAGSRGLRGRLLEYALFTRDAAEAALSDGRSLAVLEGRLFDAALGLGRAYRLRLGIRGLEEAMDAARLIYGCIGIDLRGSSRGELVIRSCVFASVYSPRVCALISALDCGLLHGLTGSGRYVFMERITEGAAACRAYLLEAAS